MSHKIPVFLVPNELTFYLKTEASDKQTITLYNPYDFAIKYRVLGTARDRYNVISSVGTVLSHHYMDVIIELKRPLVVNNGSSIDKFLLEIERIATMEERAVQERGGDDYSICSKGRRYLKAILVDGERPSRPEDEPHASSFRDGKEEGHRSVSSNGSDDEGVATATPTTANHKYNRGSAAPAVISRSLLIFCSVLVLIGALCMPHSSHLEEGSTASSQPHNTRRDHLNSVLMSSSSWIPPDYHLTVGTKLVCAYILGLITMAILRPS